MPRISEFHGIVIAMYYREHGVPHFHASYGEHVATIAIVTLDLIAGSLPPRALRLTRTWAKARRAELEANWKCARLDLPLEPIPPLH